MPEGRSRLGRGLLAAAGALCHPGVLADLEADGDAVAHEVEVAQWVELAGDLDLAAALLGPGLEPARLVVESLASQVLLGGEPRDAAIGNDAGRVVQTTPTANRHPDADDHPLRPRDELHQHRPSAIRHVRPKERVLAAVPRRTKLGEYQQPHVASARFVERRLDAPLIAGPVEWRLIQRRSRDLDRDHGSSLAPLGLPLRDWRLTGGLGGRMMISPFVSFC